MSALQSRRAELSNRARAARENDDGRRVARCDILRYLGDCAAWNSTRTHWCTLPRFHVGEHMAINQGAVLDRW